MVIYVEKIAILFISAWLQSYEAERARVRVGRGQFLRLPERLPSIASFFFRILESITGRRATAN